MAPTASSPGFCCINHDSSTMTMTISLFTLSPLVTNVTERTKGVCVHNSMPSLGGIQTRVTRTSMEMNSFLYLFFLGESGVCWAICYIQHQSVKGNMVFFLNKDIYIYLRMLCIPGNNQNSCKHYSFENIACPKKVVSWHNLPWVNGSSGQGELRHLHISVLNEILPLPF
jgi:hypothetical protein